MSLEEMWGGGGKRNQEPRPDGSHVAEEVSRYGGAKFDDSESKTWKRALQKKEKVS